MLGTPRTFDDLAAPLHAVPFVVLDLETTGGSPQRCEITEIGAVRYLAGELTGTFHTLVNPGGTIPPTITVLTGITQAMVIDAPRIDEALPALLEFIGDAVIVGHNIRFDLSFLDAAAVRLGYGRLGNHSSDTVRLSRRLLAEEVRDFRLATLAAHLRSPIAPTHRALDDARATAHVFFELLERAGAIGATDLDDLLRLPTARGAPHYGKLRLTDKLPRKPGVYLFRSGSGEVIYIGKAKDLRSRVRAYFYGDRRRRVSQMMRELTAIEHRTYATEIEAAVTEVRLIHDQRPRYNRRSLPPKSTHWLRLTDETFPRLSVVRTQRPEALAYLGPFRRRSTAEKVMYGVWDALPLRRCGGKGTSVAACRYAQLGVAICPCDGSVDPADYGRLVDRVVDGITRKPSEILVPLIDRIRRLADEHRFEEAAEVRDRYRAAVRALETRRAWRALTDAGLVWAEDAEGDSVMIHGGRLAAAWPAGDPPPLPALTDDEPLPPTPTSTLVAEELWLLWRWLGRPGVTVVDTTASLVLPVHPVPKITTLR